MIAVGFQNTVAFLADVSIDRPAVAHSRAVIGPERPFGLQVNSQLVGGLKSSPGRTPGMKTKMIDPIGHCLLVKFTPISLVHGSVARQRMGGTFHRTAQKNRTSVYKKARALGLKTAKAKLCFETVCINLSATELKRQLV